MKEKQSAAFIGIEISRIAHAIAEDERGFEAREFGAILTPPAAAKQLMGFQSLKQIQ